MGPYQIFPDPDWKPKPAALEWRGPDSNEEIRRATSLSIDIYIYMCVCALYVILFLKFRIIYIFILLLFLV